MLRASFKMDNGQLTAQQNLISPAQLIMNLNYLSQSSQQIKASRE
jgi:hypothetical protein